MYVVDHFHLATSQGNGSRHHPDMSSTMRSQDPAVWLEVVRDIPEGPEVLSYKWSKTSS